MYCTSDRTSFVDEGEMEGMSFVDILKDHPEYLEISIILKVPSGFNQVFSAAKDVLIQNEICLSAKEGANFLKI